MSKMDNGASRGRKMEADAERTGLVFGFRTSHVNRGMMIHRSCCSIKIVKREAKRRFSKWNHDCVPA